MKITMIAGGYPNLPDGIGDHAYRITLELVRQGHQVSIITKKNPKIMESPSPDHQVFPVMPLWTKEYRNLLIEKIQETKPDIVHIQYPSRSLERNLLLQTLPFFLRKLKIPTITTLHEYSDVHILRRLSILLLAHLADTVLITTQFEYDKLMRRLPWIKKKSKLVNIGSAIDVKMQKDIPQSPFQRDREPHEIFRVVHFGFVRPTKGLEWLIPAFKKVIDKNKNVRLVFISSFDPEKNEYHKGLWKLIKNLELEPYIEFSGYLTIDEIDEELLRADLSVSAYEDGLSFRRSTFLTMVAHGVPVITTKGNVKTGLNHGKHVWFFPIGDQEALAEGILELVSDPAKIDQLHEGVLELQPQFDWSNIASRTVEAYKDTIK